MPWPSTGPNASRSGGSTARPDPSPTPIAPTPRPGRGGHRPNVSKPAAVTTRMRGTGGRFESRADLHGRFCAACNKTETTQWRTGPTGQTLCNPCGIKLNRPKTSTGATPLSAAGERRRANVKEAAAKVAATAALRKKTSTTPTVPLSSRRRPPDPQSRTSTSAHASAAGASSHGFTLPRTQPPSEAAPSTSAPLAGERSKKKRRDAYEIESLLNPR